MQVRHDWTREEIRRIFELPLPELIFQAQIVHREFHEPDEVQLCRLLSIKTGGCPEDCAYCSQSAHYETGVAREDLMDPVEVLRSGQARQGGRRDALLHGRGVASGDGRQRIRARARNGARRLGARYGSLLHARHAHRIAGECA